MKSHDHLPRPLRLHMYTYTYTHTHMRAITHTHANTHTHAAQEDYVPLVNVPIMFLPNETEYNLTLTILADNALENDEVFMVVISVPEGEDRVSLLQPTSTINILNDDRTWV